MSDNRKYYYLKLKENYFDDDSIVLLESMQDGVLYSTMFQRFQIQLEQNVGIQHTVLHTFQQHDGIIIKLVFFEFQVIIFSIV